MGKGQFIQYIVLEKLDNHMQKKNVNYGPYLIIMYQYWFNFSVNLKLL